MWFFNKVKTNYVDEMREYIKDFMLRYIKEFPLSSDDVIPIFSDAEQLIRESSEKQVSKMMKVNRVNIECGALNIIQNFAMTRLEPKSAIDFLRDDANNAYALYNYVNKYKYDKGYITKQQFDENAMLATKLSLQSPLSSLL